MAKIWQRYERIATGEIVLFQQIRPGMYKNEHGVEMNAVKLCQYYQWVGAERAPRRKGEYIVNANGFKVRVKK